MGRPAIRSSLFGRSLTSFAFGMGSLDASATSSPKPSERLPSRRNTAWSRASHASGFTFQRRAAAATSITRAVAPMRRMSSYTPRTLLEPSVFWSP